MQVGFNPQHVSFVPIAALFGDCIIERSPRISWFTPAPLLQRNCMTRDCTSPSVYQPPAPQVRGPPPAVRYARRACAAEIRGETAARLRAVHHARGGRGRRVVRAGADWPAAHWHVC
jgi:hypothetical protein